MLTSQVNRCRHGYAHPPTHTHTINTNTDPVLVAYRASQTSPSSMAILFIAAASGKLKNLEKKNPKASLVPPHLVPLTTCILTLNQNYPLSPLSWYL